MRTARLCWNDLRRNRFDDNLVIRETRLDPGGSISATRSIRTGRSAGGGLEAATRMRGRGRPSTSRATSSFASSRRAPIPTSRFWMRATPAIRLAARCSATGCSSTTFVQRALRVIAETPGSRLAHRDRRGAWTRSRRSGLGAGDRAGAGGADRRSHCLGAVLGGRRRSRSSTSGSSSGSGRCRGWWPTSRAWTGEGIGLTFSMR